MMNGSKILEGYTPEFDATVVTRILDEGGHIIGKTVCEDCCFSGSSFTCSTGPILNPHDETRSAGGSSAGSAALVAGNKVDLALGGDQGGSIRIPSSFCGIVGLKPTYGLVPYTGAGSIETTVDHLGPMARTVQDCALLLEVIAGLDGKRDPRQPRDLTVPEYTKLLDAGIAGKKIGLLDEGFHFCKEEDVKNVVQTAALKLAQAGATVGHVSVPEHLDGETLWFAICVLGGYDCMIKDSGVGSLRKGHYATSLHEATNRGFTTRPYDLPISMKLTAITGEYVSRMYGKKFYAKGQNLNMLLTEAYDKALEKYDVLILPTLPYKATKLPVEGSSTSDLFENAFTMLHNTAPFDISGHPALTINAGFSESLPVGMMIVGRHFDETTVLQVARAFEKLK
ncbi:amidase-like isoform X2 [Gigantopelta aegis]|nr:amidase-like isoform X2 [Gigantopelta aegis]